MHQVALGIEQFCSAPPPGLSGKRLGLLSNAASVNHQLTHSLHLLHHCFGDQLKALFSPQHGFFAEKQDNMIESFDRLDPFLRIPLFSLYSQTRHPTQEMMALIDVLLVDLQDSGTRVYTFACTMAYCMQAARQYGKQVLVLDRPNPIGGATIEGNCLLPNWRSFVGPYPIPMRHGMTLAELALMFNHHFEIGCDLDVIPMAGWHRSLTFSQTDLPWVAPSPNLPTPTSALVYPGQVIWEGTNVSEGRGTTQPFELCGAPFIEPQKVLAAIGTDALPGVILRPMEFEPTANKWQGRLCHGFQLHVIDPNLYRPYATSLKLMQAVIRCHPSEFQWKSPPYEYEWERLPIDLILGSQQIRLRLVAMDPVDTIEASWREELDSYQKMRRQYFLYPSL